MNNYIKIQPSNGIMRDKDGRIAALVWIFRPDVIVEDRHWFENPNITDGSYLCVEVGSDNIPVNCKKVFTNFDRPNEWFTLEDEAILKCFEFCCHLLSNKTDIQLGSEILKDILLGDIK